MLNSTLMEFVITSAPNTPIYRSTQLPGKFDQYLCHYTNPLFFQSNKLDIILHKCDINDSSITNTVFLVKEPVVLETNVKYSGLRLGCMLRGSIEVRYKKTGKMILYQGQFDLREVKEDNVHITLKPGVYEWQSIFFSPRLISQMAVVSPTAKKWADPDAFNHNKTMGDPRGIIWKGLHRKIDELKKSIVQEKYKHYWLQALIQETLILMLDHEDGTAQIVIEDHEKGLFQMIKSYVDLNLDIRHTVAELAHNYHISESKLKKGFAKYFEIPISKYLVKRKMEMAQQMILESDNNINAIAYMLGYNYPANFTREFKRYYGVLPGAVR